MGEDGRSVRDPDPDPDLVCHDPFSDVGESIGEYEVVDGVRDLECRLIDAALLRRCAVSRMLWNARSVQDEAI